MTIKVRVNTLISRNRYDAAISTGGLEDLGAFVLNCLGGAKRRVAILTNRTIAPIYSEPAAKSLRAKGFNVFQFILPDGEKHKNLRSLSHVLDYLGENEFQRTDAVISLGGGVIGDIAGFAAAIYLRGIPYIQVPTTLLSMIDSSVGGKTGINTGFGKNLLGAFHQPSGVFIDPSVLKTLHQREITAGLSEAVKQAILSGGKLFQITSDLLESIDPKNFADFLTTNSKIDQVERFIAAQIRFKASVVRGDERERAADYTSKSRKILNFGHTFAHALEKVTQFQYLRHGEAVGHGMLFAADLSKRLEMLDNHSVKLLNDVVHRCGPLPPIAHIAPEAILQALKYDKKNLDGKLQWVLLEGIGKPKIFPGTDIPASVLTSTIKAALRK